MKNRLFKLIVFGFILLFSSPVYAQKSEQSSGSVVVKNNPETGLWQEAETSPIQFELGQTYNKKGSIIFSDVRFLQGPVADDDGNIYVIDSKSGVMYSFAPDGSLRWEKGQKGRGPGDFLRPYGLVTDGQFLYTVNESGTRIDVFNYEGNLVQSLRLMIRGVYQPKIAGIIADSLLVITSSLPASIDTKSVEMGFLITVVGFGKTINKVNQFKVFTEPVIQLPAGFYYGVDISIVDSLIVAGNYGNYSLRFFNIHGELVKKITRDFQKLVSPGILSGSISTVARLGFLEAPVELWNHYLLTIVNWPTNIDDPDEYIKKRMDGIDIAPQFKSSIDLFRSDGTLLYSGVYKGRWPVIGNIVYADKSGNIYAKSNDPFPQIRRYQVIINEPDKY